MRAFSYSLSGSELAVIAPQPKNSRISFVGCTKCFGSLHWNQNRLEDPYNQWHHCKGHAWHLRVFRWFSWPIALVLPSCFHGKGFLSNSTDGVSWGTLQKWLKLIDVLVQTNTPCTIPPPLQSRYGKTGQVVSYQICYHDVLAKLLWVMFAKVYHFLVGFGVGQTLGSTFDGLQKWPLGLFWTSSVLSEAENAK